MTDVPEVAVTRSPYSHPGSAGKPLHPVSAKRQIELARHHGRKALLVGIRRLTKYLADPESPVDAIYLKAWSELASRCGMPALTTQAVDQRSLNISMGPEEVHEAAKRLLREVLEQEEAERG